MQEAISLAFNQPNAVDLPRIDQQSAREVLDLINWLDDTDTRRAARKLSAIYGISPPINVVFQGLKQIPSVDRNTPVVLAFTDGKTITMNGVTQTAGFLEGRLNLGPRVIVPSQVNHFQAVFLHEFGHVLHFRKKNVSVFRALWEKLLRSVAPRPPTLEEMRSYEETVADAYATSFFVDAGYIRARQKRNALATL